MLQQASNVQTLAISPWLMLHDCQTSVIRGSAGGKISTGAVSRVM